MKIAILGAGALGSLIGALLARRGHQVQLLMRNQTSIRAITRDGLSLTIAGQTETIPIPACVASSAQSPVDLVILLTKTYQSEAALKDAQHLLSRNTAVLSLQNGIGNAERIAAHLPLSQVYVGISMMPADQIAPGQVSSQGQGHSRFYAADGTDRPFTRELGDIFTDAGMACTVDPDIQKAIWEKAAFNAASNAVLAITGTTPGRLLEYPDAMRLTEDIALESVAIAKAAGVAVEATAVAAMLQTSSKKHPEHRPSMAQDILARRRTEVDAINGAFVSHAARLGMPAPLNKTIWTLVRLAEAGYSRL